MFLKCQLEQFSRFPQLVGWVLASVWLVDFQRMQEVSGELWT